MMEAVHYILSNIERIDFMTKRNTKHNRYTTVVIFLMGACILGLNHEVYKQNRKIEKLSEEIYEVKGE